MFTFEPVVAEYFALNFPLDLESTHKRPCRESCGASSHTFKQPLYHPAGVECPPDEWTSQMVGLSSDIQSMRLELIAGQPDVRVGP
jgi:hypothetical protein